MTDLETLRGRVEQAEARLKGVRDTRERDSATLVEMWQQLRVRFAAQEEEIARARGRAATLEAENQELLAMVNALVETIEGNVTTMPETVVPEVGAITADVLDTPPSAAATAEPEPEIEHEPTQALQRDPTLDEAAIEALLVEDVAPATAQPVAAEPAPATDADAAPAGIKTLMSRVQRAMGRNGDRRNEPPTTEVADLLDADTHEDEEAIKALRRELHGLKARVTASTRRH